MLWNPVHVQVTVVPTPPTTLLCDHTCGLATISACVAGQGVAVGGIGVVVGGRVVGVGVAVGSGVSVGLAVGEGTGASVRVAVAPGVGVEEGDGRVAVASIDAVADAVGPGAAFESPPQPATAAAISKHTPSPRPNITSPPLQRLQKGRLAWANLPSIVLLEFVATPAVGQRPMFPLRRRWPKGQMLP